LFSNPDTNASQNMAAPKRSYSTYAEDVPPPPAPNTNGWGKFYAPSKFRENRSVHTNIDEWLLFFENELEKGEKSLPKTTYPTYDQSWASNFSRAVISTAEHLVKSFGKSRLLNVKTKVGALHALVEMAMAIDQAPDDVRNGKAPEVLMESMLLILESMDVVDLGKTSREEAFLSKVKQLRRRPGQGHDCRVWSGLDEVFRLLKVSRPIDFRRCSRKVRDILEVDQEAQYSGVQILKIIQNEICAPVYQGTCFETKYNALDALVEIAYHLTERPLRGRADPRSVIDALIEGLSRMPRIMTVEETSKIATELQTAAEFSSKIPNDYVAIAYSNDSSVKYQWNEYFALFVAKKRAETQREHGKHGLLAKIIRLRAITETSRGYSWASSSIPDIDRLHFALEDVVEAFIDASVPLGCSHFLHLIDPVFIDAEHSIAYTTLVRSQYIVQHTIKQLSNRAERRACFETKLNTFKALMQIGTRIVSFKLKQKVQPRRDNYPQMFEDGTTETLFTNALLSIFKSLGHEDWSKITSDDTFCNAIFSLNKTARFLPGTLPGLQAVADFVRKPPKDFVGRVMTSVGKADVVDLTAD
jgi:hypothetical protein